MATRRLPLACSTDLLTKRSDTLRDMIEVVAGSPNQYTSNNLELVGGGEVLKAHPLSGVDPAWRSTYLVSIAARGWPQEANDSTVQAVQNDITYIKGGAMRLQTPGMGSYLNEVRAVQCYINSDSMANGIRLTAMIPFGHEISTALITTGFSRPRRSTIPKIPFTALRAWEARHGLSITWMERTLDLCARRIYRGIHIVCNQVVHVDRKEHDGALP